MAKIYKIHPSIGFARLGNSSAYFLGPETPGGPGIEISSTGAESPVTQYKSGGLLKKQGARFRVWEYEKASNGALTPLREITAAEAKITWKVHLVNSKAAGKKIVSKVVGGRQVLVPGTIDRNKGTPRDQLTIDGGADTITKGEAAKTFRGRFLNKKDVTLGEITTDSAGRLIVLSAISDSEGFPVTGVTVPPLDFFDNNDRWHDNVADGPVTATIQFPSQAAIPVDAPSWVIIAPPDFAPAVGGVVSLYDVAVQAAIDRKEMSAPTTVSFRQHVLPTLRRASSLRWVHKFAKWSAISSDYTNLSKTTAASALLRRAAAQAIRGPELLQFSLPKWIRDVLADWEAGTFTDDFGSGPVMFSVPDALDRAALEACVGAGFFPGIETSFTFSTKAWWADGEAFRFSHQKIAAGQATQGMALPWQADFNDCDENWWPSQRPNFVFKTTDTSVDPPPRWARGVFSDYDAKSRATFLANVFRLGVITPVTQGSNTFLIENERDMTLDQS